MNFTQQVFDDFYKITKNDIYTYFSNALNFMQTDYVTIQQFYQGKLNKITARPFNNFSNLQTQTINIFQIFKQFGKQFNNLEYWDLLTQVEEIDNRLKTLANINRWSRSSLSNVGFSPNPQLNIILNKNGSLERISQDLLGSKNPNDDWVTIALNNDLIEENYTSAGGTNINVQLTSQSGFNFKLNSVVDVIDDQSVYGLDLQQQLEFDINQDYNDLVVLSYDDTILQAIQILITLKQNDNPDFPNNGLQTLILGESKASFNFPVIIRQLQATFNTDDSLKNLTIGNISYSQDNLTVSFSVQSRLGEVYNLQESLN